jgi:predicted ATPase/class 3 adenylate cyclase
LNLPTGTITLFFTDIEGSTRLWEQHPEQMRQALARHDALAADLIHQHSGVLVKSRGEGDSLFAVFARATDALAAACELQQAFVSEPWPAETPLRVRMALHTGEADLRDGDYYGSMVNRGARLRAIAHGGQVLLSEVTHDLNRDALPPSVTLKSLGEHRLKDLGRPETVFQLLHPDLPSDFPPLRSLDNPDLPNNLPQQVTSFIGREKEIAEIKALLARTRLLTLTGSGGCGKTRLSLQVAAEMPENYSDGVWLVELSPLSDPDLVPKAVANVLDVREAPGQSLLQTLTTALKSRRLLIVLDNCEHLLAACAQLADALIRACPNVKVLASSREGLNIAGELTYRVPSLSLPERGQVVTVETLSQYEAARLFIDRAAAVASDFAVTDANAPALASICHHLDGIPLAIELAAARVRALSVEEIHARLDQRLRLLIGGSRTALPRQQTLRAAIDWSYDLLNDRERLLLHRLSVFAGGWTLAMAETVCAGEREEGRGKREEKEEKREGRGKRGETREEKEEREEREEKEKADANTTTYRATVDTSSLPPGPGPLADAIHPSLFPLPCMEVLDLLTSLVDKSLVVTETKGANTRYRLLETVGQYAEERLQASGEELALRNRHLDCFLALAEEAEAQLTGPDQVRWYARLETEHDNLRTALQFSPSRQGAGSRLCGALWRFWHVRGHLSEGRERCAVVLAQADAQERTMARAKALNGAGVLAYDQGDNTPAQTLLEESLAIAREFGNRRGIASALTNLGIVAWSQADYAKARSCWEESLKLDRELGDKREIAVSLHNLGIMAREQADYAAARLLFEESLTVYRELGDKRSIVLSLNCQGIVAYACGDYALARSLMEESLKTGRELGDRYAVAHALNILGSTARVQRDYAESRSLHEQSLGIFQELGDRGGITLSLHNLGVVAYDRGEFDSARSLQQESLTIRREVGDKRGCVEGLEAFARLAMADGQPEHAARLWGAAEALRETIGSPLPPNDRDAYDRNLAAVRKALDKKAFLTAWAEGRALTLEQAIQYALEETDN